MREDEPNQEARLPVSAAWLVEAATGVRHALAGAFVTIGRSGHLAFSEDPYLSRHHAQIATGEGAFWFIDLESANGSFINARPAVGPQRLSHGDLILVGNTALRFEAPEAKKASP